MEVRGQLGPGQLGERAGEERLDLHGIGHAGRVAEADLVRPRGGEPAGDLDHPAGVDDALVRAAERRRDHRRAAQAVLADRRNHPLERLERLVDAAVDVLAVVRLRRAEEDRDLVEAVAVLEGGRQASLVGHEDGQLDAVGDVDAVQHVDRIVELRDDVGTHEARDLDPAQPRPCERVDEPHLVLRRDALGLVLEAVARSDLPDADALWRSGGRHALTEVVNLS